MTRKKLANGLTQQQEDFCKYYTDIGIGYNALLKAYPSAKNWKRNSADCQVQKLLNKPLIDQRIKELNDQKTNALLNSTKLNQRKLLESALNILENTQNNPQQYAHAINVLKLLYAQQGMMPKNDNQTTINIINNNSIDNISNFLDL